eukprot:1816378-Alexandrium_andersonii.AAC.1
MPARNTSRGTPTQARDCSSPRTPKYQCQSYCCPRARRTASIAPADPTPRTPPETDRRTPGDASRTTRRGP